MIIIFRKELYNLKYSGIEFCAHLAKTLKDIGFLSNKADPDVWYNPVVKPNEFE